MNLKRKKKNKLTSGCFMPEVMNVHLIDNMVRCKIEFPFEIHHFSVMYKQFAVRGRIRLQPWAEIGLWFSKSFRSKFINIRKKKINIYVLKLASFTWDFLKIILSFFMNAFCVTKFLTKTHRMVAMFPIFIKQSQWVGPFAFLSICFLFLLSGPLLLFRVMLHFPF